MTEAPVHLQGLIALMGAKAAYETDKRKEGVLLAHRGIEAYPPQPREQPVDPVLGQLLGWDVGLHNLMAQMHDDEVPELIEPTWRQGRAPTAMGCTVEWLERRAPDYPRNAAAYDKIIAVVLELYLDADGSVIRIDPTAEKDSAGFTDSMVEALSHWRAAPQPRAECRGPWMTTFMFRLGP